MDEIEHIAWNAKRLYYEQKLENAQIESEILLEIRKRILDSNENKDAVDR